MKNLAIFDFCSTLCKYETAGDFVDFVLRSQVKQNVIINKLISIFSHRYIIDTISFLFPKFNFSKKLKLFFLSGIQKSDLEELGYKYFNYCKNDLNIPIVQLLERHVANGDHVIIVSGGLEVYLIYFKEYLNINNVIGTKLKYFNKSCCGVISGKDCMYDEKVKKIKAYISSNRLNFESIVSYSDSINDLSLLKFSNKSFVVSKTNSQAWASIYGFNEIII
jgi:HAD superfamily hydrolase (TIGR01490 family)